MSEIIEHLPYNVADVHGREYYVSVAGNRRADGEWEGWLEFVPLDESEPLITPTETTQSNRGALQHWAEALTEAYVQGAFTRAVTATAAGTESRAVAERVDHAAVVAATVDLPDPFRLFTEGRETMRARLNAWPRATLLNIIAASNLNPAGKSLAWLTERQLVTFIVTAVEAQLSAGRRSA
jgi:hypothetical protein